jgi:MFS family permease
MERLTGALVIAALFMGSTLLTPVYELYRSHYGLTPLTVVLLYSVYVIGNLAALLFLGRVSDRVGRRPVALAGLALAVASAALFAWAAHPGWLFAARVVNGLAVGVGAGAATAWITEFTPQGERAQAASLMTLFNFIGLTVGPVLAGSLVQYAPDPLQLPFIVYAGLLIAVMVLAARTPETVRRHELTAALLRPRLGVPRGSRLAFAAPAAAGFVAMSVVGFYAALGPTLVHDAFEVRNRAVSAAIVAVLFAVAAGVIALSRSMGASRAMRTGLMATPVGLGLLVGAQGSGSLVLMVLGTVMCGVAAALAYRGSLSRINEIAPQERRAEVTSAYFVCCFLGNAVPVIGVGALAQHASLQFATRLFAIVLVAVTAAAWVGARKS